MSVREIIYLDEATLASFVSQSRGFLEEFVTEADSVERAMDLARVSSETELNKSASQNGTEPAKETQARQGARVKACECTSNPSNAGERRVSAGRRRDVL
jgi:hypothetical protein